MVDPMKCIAKVANRTKLSEKTKRHAMNIMNYVTKSGISAAGSYGTSGLRFIRLPRILVENITQIDIAEARPGVTEVTIRNRFKLSKVTRSKLRLFL